MNHKRLSKSLILFSLILSIIVFIPMFNLAAPTISYATEVDEIEVEAEDEAKKEEYTIGVNRATNLETNKQIFSDQMMSVGKVAFAFIVFITIVMTGINAIIQSYDGKSRAEIIEKFKHIIYGVLLFALAAFIVAIASEFQEKIITELYDAQYTEVEMIAEIDDTLSTNWLANIMELALKIIGRLLEYVIQLLFSVITLEPSNMVNAATGDSQYSLNNILFLADFGDIIDLNAENSMGVKLTTAPFTTAEWSRYTKAYFLLTSVSVPLMLIALMKVAYEMVLNAGNFEKVMEVKKTTLRICTGIVIVALGPYLFRGVLTIFNMMVYLIPVEFTFDIVVEDINEANGLLAVITSLWWLWIKFRIMLLFVVREIMLTVMYISTPVVIGMWSVSEKTKALNRWIGETVTNAATQFCYAMVFFIATVILNGGQTNAFFTLLWLSMMLKLANFFKESFQGLFDKWGGIDEAGVADGFSGKITGWATKATNSVIDTVDPNRAYGVSRVLTNSFAISNFAKTGDISGFTSSGKAEMNVIKAAKKDGNELIRNANALANSRTFKEAIETNENAQQIDKLYAEMFRTNKNTPEGKIIYDNNKAEIARIINENPGDPGVQVVNQSHEMTLKGQEKLQLVNTTEPFVKKKYGNQILNGVANDLADRKQAQIENMALGKRTSVSTPISRLTAQYSNAGSAGSSGAAGQPQRIDMVNPTQKLGGMTPPALRKEKIKEKLISEGVKPSAITDEKLIKEANDMMTKMNGNIIAAKNAVNIQKEANSRAVTEDVKQKQMKNTNKQVEKCITEISKLYKEGYAESNDKKVANKLKDLAKEVEYNGDFELAKKLKDEIKNIGPIDSENAKL